MKMLCFSNSIFGWSTLAFELEYNWYDFKTLESREACCNSEIARIRLLSGGETECYHA